MEDIKENRKKINWKYVSPQIYSTLIVTAFNLEMAVSLSYPTFLIPQLEDEKSDIKVTITQSSWTATISTLTQTIVMLFHGFFIHKFGTLKTMKLSAIPGIFGWIIVANARDIHSLLLGRFLTGISVSLAAASNIYVTEITRPDIRGSLLIILSTYVSTGIVLSNVLGYYCHWRVLAWIYSVIVLIPVTLSFLLSDSPIWLIYKGRLNEAKESLRIFNRFYPNPEQETERQFDELIRDHKMKIAENSLNKNTFQHIISNYSKPAGFKPLLLCVGLFFFQAFSGIYIIIVHSIIFFKGIDSDIDENLVPIILGIVRLIMGIGTIFLMKHFTKRQLAITSNIGMIICMFTSGTFTYYIQNGTSDLKWVPLCCMILYIISAMIGMIPIPWMLTSEIQPTSIRGFSNGISAAIGNGMMSLSLQNYRYIENSLGSSGIQYLFGTIGIFSTIFVWLFLPNTHDKKLIEIEEYFENNWIYIKKRKDKGLIIVNMEMETVDPRELNR